MTDLITEYADYDSFAREWHSGTLADYNVSLNEARERGLLNEQRTRKLWQLLGLLNLEECLLQLPEWLAEKRVGSENRTTPTIFLGYISDETEDAILFESSAAARSLMGLAHRIRSHNKGVERTEDETDRHEQLADWIRDHERQFDD